jgi:amino acid transporter
VLPIRFRIRTMMIVIALLAVLTGLLMLQFRLTARMNSSSLFAVELAAIIVFVVPLLLQFYVLAAYFWRGPTRRGEFSMTENPRRRKDPAGSAAPRG